MAIYSLLLLMAFLATADADAYILPKILQGKISHPQQRTAFGACDITICMKKSAVQRDAVPGLKLEALDSIEAVDRTCQGLMEIKDCISNILVACAGDLKPEIYTTADSIQEAYSFLCVEGGKDAVISTATCWKKPEIKTHLQTCLASLSSFSVEDECIPINGVRLCFMETAQSLCSEKVVLFIDNLMYRVLLPYATQLFGCDISPPITGAKPLGGTIGGMQTVPYAKAQGTKRGNSIGPTRGGKQISARKNSDHVTGAHVLPTILQGQISHLRPRDVSKTCNLTMCMTKSAVLQDPVAGLKLEALDSTEAVNETCQKLIEMQSCIRNVLESCPQHFGPEAYPLVNVMEGLHSYLCLEGGKDVAISEASCWKKPEFKKQLKTCLEAQTVSKNVKQSLSSYPDMCTQVHGIRQCFVETTRDQCSRKAVTFVDNLIFRVLQPFAIEVFGCNISPPITGGSSFGSASGGVRGNPLGGMPGYIPITPY